MYFLLSGCLCYFPESISIPDLISLFLRNYYEKTREHVIFPMRLDISKWFYMFYSIERWVGAVKHHPLMDQPIWHWDTTYFENIIEVPLKLRSSTSYWFIFFSYKKTTFLWRTWENVLRNVEQWTLVKL